jgi:methionyl-tRNA formyltransferase
MLKKRSEYKIIFYGTPDFAVESLKALHAAGFNLQAVVTVADKPAGRGRKLQKSAVKKYAEANNIPVFQPKNLKSPDFHAKLKALQPDLQVVVAFRMLPDTVIEAAKDGTINLHASLLPQFRGAAPINHALMQGEKKTGVTTFFIDSKIDTGAIIGQKTTGIQPNDTAGSLHDKLMVTGALLLTETVDNIMYGQAESKPQEMLIRGNELKKAPKIYKENCYVNFDQDYRRVYDFIRGLTPYPAARIRIRHKSSGDILECLLLNVQAQKESHEHKTGSFVSDNKRFFKIAAQNGFIEVLDIKAEGKKAMDIKSFLNGFDLSAYVLE